ncbi:ATP-dependent DNA helicase PIF1-like protein [Tanacetum coccineum]
MNEGSLTDHPGILTLANMLNKSIFLTSNTNIRQDGKVHSYCGLKLVDIHTAGAGTSSASKYAHTHVSRRPKGVPVVYHNLGPPSHQCSMCNATMWYNERSEKSRKAVTPTFSLCCQEGLDRATIAIQKNVKAGDNGASDQIMLNYHLPEQNVITLHDTENLPALLEREGISITIPLKLWEENWVRLLEDIFDKKRKHYRYPELNLSDEQIIKSVHNDIGQFCFIHGPGGTGKTFLYNTIIARLRSEQMIVLVVASLGIASLLLPAGRTAHSRFIIPLELMENSTCGIKQNTHLAELMQHVRLIIWDEAPMTQRYVFEALDKTLRDILGYKNPAKRNRIFGGMTVLLGGDFRQILPVIPNAKRPEVIQACINQSELWKYCKVFTLTRSMHVNGYGCNGEIDNRKQDFNRWVLAVGDGKLPAKKKETEDEPTWIEIPEEFLIKSWTSLIEKIIAETYPDFTSRQTDDEYLKERAILTPRNDDADAINENMFKKLGGALVTYNSADEICKASTDTADQHNLYPVEFLNSLNFQGMPPMPSA